jgi:polysaccharide pyruvyl transferase WcaK-like protein
MTTDYPPGKISFFGMFGVGNLGNEATLQAMLHNVRRFLPNAGVSCICAGPEAVAQNYSIPAYLIREFPLPPLNSQKLRLLRKALLAIPLELCRWLMVARRLKSTDMVVMTGTGMLSDLDIHPLGLHYDILRWSVLAKLYRCKLAFVSVGAGPIRHPLSRFFVKAALRMADYHSFRDNFSRSYVEGLGISKGNNVYPDLAFSLPRDVAAPYRPSDSRRPVIGVGLITNDRRRDTLERDDAIYQDYVRSISALVGWLVAHKYTVRLLIGDVEYDSRARQDLKSSLERSGLMGPDIIDEPAQSAGELLSQLVRTDIVVASRFHNILLALMLKKPVVAISFHEKVDSLMRAMGLTRFCHDIEHIDVNALIEQLMFLEEHIESISCDLDRKTEAYRTALDEQYDTIFKGFKINKPLPQTSPRGLEY